MCKQMSIWGGGSFLTNNYVRGSITLIRNKSSTTRNSILYTSFCCLFFEKYKKLRKT